MHVVFMFEISEVVVFLYARDMKTHSILKKYCNSKQILQPNDTKLLQYFDRYYKYWEYAW